MKDVNAARKEPSTDRRQFPRLAAGVRVRFHQLTMSRSSREYLRGVAADVSLGGLFVASRPTFPVGTPVELEFHVPDDAGSTPVRAHAVVCWRRRWREPRGMGLRFVGFDFLGQRRLSAWLERILERHSIGA